MFKTFSFFFVASVLGYAQTGSGVAANLVLSADAAAGQEGRLSSTLADVNTSAGMLFVTMPPASVQPADLTGDSTRAASRWHFGFTTVNFDADALNGKNLGQVETAYSSADGNIQVANTATDFHFSQFLPFVSYAFSPCLRVTATVPLVHSFFGLSSASGTWTPGQSFVKNGRRTQQTEAAGLGDIQLRLESEVWRRSRWIASAGADLRLATGDARQFLGSGAAGVHPFASLRLRGRFAPRAEAGYWINGRSILAANPADGSRNRLPNLFTASAGGDLRLTSHLTAVVDWQSYRWSYAQLAQQRSTISGGLRITLPAGLTVATTLVRGLHGNGFYDNFQPVFSASYRF